MRLLIAYMVLLSFIYFTFLCGLKLLHCVETPVCLSILLGVNICLFPVGSLWIELR